MCGGPDRQQELATDVGAFRYLERELVVGYGHDGVAAAADGTAGAVRVADVLEGESGGEAEGCSVAGQDRLHGVDCCLQLMRERQAKYRVSRRNTVEWKMVLRRWNELAGDGRRGESFESPYFIAIGQRRGSAAVFGEIGRVVRGPIS